MDDRHNFACSACSLIAASPLGDELRLLTMSPTEEVAKPTFSPICESVNPTSCNSRIRLAHVTGRFMDIMLRLSVTGAQRHTVTVIRSNATVTIGDRIKEWREKRGLTVEQLAARVGLRPTTIYDLERGDSKSTKKLHIIANVLKVNVLYLENGKGVPEDMHAQKYEQDGWPFKFDRKRFDTLSPKDRSVIEAAVLALVENLEKSTARMPLKKRG